MGTQDFRKFVASQHVPDTGLDINWAEMRDEWLTDLDSLYKLIVEFLEEYIQAGSISYGFADVQLSEENLGEYRATRMDIKIGKQLVSLIPVGTLLVASKGRVDAVGSSGRAQILLLDQRARGPTDLIKVTVSIGKDIPPPAPPQGQPISWAWKIVTNAAPRKFVDLNKESFLALLMDIAHA